MASSGICRCNLPHTAIFGKHIICSSLPVCMRTGKAIFCNQHTGQDFSKPSPFTHGFSASCNQYADA